MRGKFAIIAHRGLSAVWPENSADALLAAMDCGARWLEIDIHVTKDGCPVVVHDSNLGRLCGVNSVVGLNRFSNLPRTLAGTRIPKLEDILVLADARRVGIHLEIKDRRALEPTLLLAERSQTQLVVSSFDHQVVKRSKDINPHIPTMALFDEPLSQKDIEQTAAAMSADMVGVNLEHWMASGWKRPAWSWPTYGYTANSRTEALWAKNRGFAGVYADHAWYAHKVFS